MRRVVLCIAVGSFAAATAVVGPGSASAARPMASPAAGVEPNQSGMHPTAVASVTAAGDLNHDGHPDVLDVRQVTTTSHTDRYGFTARTGSTGKVLWSKSIDLVGFGSNSVYPMAVGKKGQLGVVYVNSTFQNTMTPGDQTITVTVAAFAGKTGKMLWAKKLQGSSDVSNGYSTAPFFRGFVHDAKGAVLSALINEQTTEGGSNLQTTPIVLSLVRGATHSLGSPVNVPAGTGFAQVLPAPDLDGNGRDDVVALVPGAASKVVAESGVNGHPLWSTSAPPVDAFSAASAVRGYDTGKIADLMIQGPGTGSLQSFTVVKGATGHVVWKRQASSFYLIGRSGKPHRPVIGLLTYTDTSDATNARTGVLLQAVSPANKVVYQSSIGIAVKRPTGADSSGSGAGFDVFGDVQADGSADAHLDLHVDASSPTHTNSQELNGYVDGATGQLTKVAFDVGAAGSLHHGLATDLLATTVHKGKPFITARRGTTGKRYYKRAIAGLHKIQGIDVAGLRVAGTGCSNIEYGAVRGTTDQIGLLSARGSVLWSVTFPESAATGGKVTHHKKPKHYCV